jgi:flagellar biosynthesis protein FlhB
VSDGAEKPFEATPHRVAKARREGNVARSSEVAANAAFGAAAAIVVAIVPAFASLAHLAFAFATAGAVPWWPCSEILALALIPAAGAAAAATLASLAQSAGLAFVPVTAKLERLNPIEGMKRMLSRDTLAHAARAAIAFAVASAAMLAPIAHLGAVASRATTFVQVAATAWSASQRLAASACAIGVCFAFAEFGAARRAWLRKLRMSFDERKNEAKEQEGDPFARGRRRSLHRALVRGALAKVKDASFVVANPTHVAVALEYRPPHVPVPRVLVRAADAGALRVRELAALHHVPVVENIPLARALFAGAAVGETIPHAHYVAVAEVVAALVRSKELAP